jgi:hypothetical protein
MDYGIRAFGLGACGTMWACSLLVDLSNTPTVSVDAGTDVSDARLDGQSVLDAERPPLPDAGPETDANTANVRYIFVTAGDFPGDFGTTDPAEALANADNNCKLEADMYTDPGHRVLAGRKWKAWLSNQTTSAISRIDQKSSLTWIRMDGAVIFQSISDITTRLLLVPIAISGSTTVWTGTDATTGAAALTCGNWLDRAGRGTYGVSSALGRSWSASSSDYLCNAGRSLYCFETRN